LIPENDIESTTAVWQNGIQTFHERSKKNVEDELLSIGEKNKIRQ
jgi:hypothetical protein